MRRNGVNSNKNTPVLLIKSSVVCWLIHCNFFPPAQHLPIEAKVSNLFDWLYCVLTIEMSRDLFDDLLDDSHYQIYNDINASIQNSRSYHPTMRIVTAPLENSHAMSFQRNCFYICSARKCFFCLFD